MVSMYFRILYTVSLAVSLSFKSFYKAKLTSCHQYPQPGKATDEHSSQNAQLIPQISISFSDLVAQSESIPQSIAHLEKVHIKLMFTGHNFIFFFYNVG